MRAAREPTTKRPQSTYCTWVSYYGEVPLYRIYDPDAPVGEHSFKVREGAM